MKKKLLIGNFSGFYGDRESAAQEMVEGGDLDVLTGDFLAELTMFILWKAKQAGRPGYATTFLRQAEGILGACMDRGIKIVTNAGGLDPGALARDLDEVATRLGLSPRIAYVSGDDLFPHLADLEASGHELRNLDTGAAFTNSGLTPVTANAYLGARGIAKALELGADIVVCPRVTDASLVVGPCIWNFGWRADEYDRLAGAVAAGHIIECGAQATGGNFARFDEIDDDVLPGLPIAEISADGSAVITKHPGSPGAVTIDTVTAQLVYEVGGVQYLNPDTVLRLDSLQLDSVGSNRVRVSGALGLPAPMETKVSMSCLGPYRQAISFGITGRQIEAKADLLKKGLLRTLRDTSGFADIDWRLTRSDHSDAPVNDMAVARMTVTFTSWKKENLGRRIFDAGIGLALSSFPGFYYLEDSQRQASATGIHWPFLIPQSVVNEVIHFEGAQVALPPREPAPLSNPRHAAQAPPTAREPASGPTIRVALGELALGRSGDKGANANVGLWVRDSDAYEWLRDTITVDRFRALLPEAAQFRIAVAALPNLRALNFVIFGILGQGAAEAMRFDPQAKGLAEYVLSREMDIPTHLLSASSTTLEAVL